MDVDMKNELVEQIKTMKWNTDIVIISATKVELEVYNISFDPLLNRIVIEI